MATNEKIKKDTQELNTGSGLVELYQLDASDPNIGGDVYHFTPGILGDEGIRFGGVYYFPVPCESEGFEYNGDGKLPRPLIRVSNVSILFQAAVKAYKDLVGAKLTRMRTYLKYLDGQSEADASAQFPTDVYYIERKSRQNKQIIEWEMRSAIDIAGVLIPKGRVLESCTRFYRLFDAAENDFEYVDGADFGCPYSRDTGDTSPTGDYFDENDQPCARADDKCSKTLDGCRARYKDSDADYKNFGLPTSGFPGVGRIGYPYR